MNKKIHILVTPVLSMIAVVVISNILVAYPINDWLTWGAITYPFSFFITDVMNRLYGPQRARHVVYAGFACAVVMSIGLAGARIAMASGMAFIVGQCVDIFLFHKMRNMDWWKPPFVSSTVGSFVDTVLFFSLAFAGTDVPWVTLGLGDFAVKLALALLFLAPFRVLIARCLGTQGRIAKGG